MGPMGLLFITRDNAHVYILAAFAVAFNILSILLTPHSGIALHCQSLSC